MVRDFSDEPVSLALVEQLLVNATRTPSAGYSQGPAFVEVQHALLIATLAQRPH